jgi:hypothetical protein
LGYVIRVDGALLRPREFGIASCRGTTPTKGSRRYPIEVVPSRLAGRGPGLAAERVLGGEAKLQRQRGRGAEGQIVKWGDEEDGDEKRAMKRGR